MIKAFKDVQFDLLSEEEDSTDTEPETDNEINEDSEMDVSEEIDFEKNEEESNEACEKFGLTRLACVSHTLQLVVSKFDIDKSAKSLLSNTFKIVNSVSKSSKVTEALVNASGKKLVSRCKTRWTSTYFVIKRLLEVKEELKRVLLDHNMTMLQPNEWEDLELVEQLLAKFAYYTNLSGGEKYSTLSSVIPLYVDLELHLIEMKSKPAMVVISELLLKELHKRFKKFTDINDTFQFILWLQCLIQGTEQV
jgi:hypothetical protein